jgi:hypothetical protein
MQYLKLGQEHFLPHSHRFIISQLFHRSMARLIPLPFIVRYWFSRLVTVLSFLPKSPLYALLIGFRRVALISVYCFRKSTGFQFIEVFCIFLCNLSQVKLKFLQNIFNSSMIPFGLSCPSSHGHPFLSFNSIIISLYRAFTKELGGFKS